MKINQKILSILVSSLSVITICLAVLSFLIYVNTNIMFVFLGLTTLVGGLSQLNMAHQIDSKGLSKGSNKVGMVAVIAGVFLIILSSYYYY